MDAPQVQDVTTDDGYNIAHSICGDGWQLVLMPVRPHVTNIFVKTGVANRAEAATYATRSGSG